MPLFLEAVWLLLYAALQLSNSSCSTTIMSREKNLMMWNAHEGELKLTMHEQYMRERCGMCPKYL